MNVTTARFDSSSLRYAGFWRRTGAYLLDGVLAWGVLLPWVYVLQQTLRPRFGAHQLGYGAVEFLLTDFIVLFVIAALWVRYRATPGMLLLGLKLVDAENGAALSYKQALARVFMRIIAILTVIGILLMLFDRQKQALHDKVCNTLVLDVEDDYADERLPVNGAAP